MMIMIDANLTLDIITLDETMTMMMITTTADATTTEDTKAVE